MPVKEEGFEELARRVEEQIKRLHGPVNSRSYLALLHLIELTWKAKADKAGVPTSSEFEG